MKIKKFTTLNVAKFFIGLCKACQAKKSATFEVISVHRIF